jgi:hypothetical protein
MGPRNWLGCLNRTTFLRDGSALILMPFVSITRLRVRSWRYLPGFLIQSFRAARQARRAAGSLAVSVLRDADRAFWTRTVWRDEAAMRAFMRSGVHRRIKARLPAWCDEAALAHWVQGASEPPSWSEAYRLLQQGGRRARVNHPSEAQRRFEIREPRTSAGVVFKYRARRLSHQPPV